MTWFLVVAVVAINILKGGSILAIKLGMEGLPPVLGAGIRFTAAGVLILAWTAFRRSGNNRPHGAEARGANARGAQARGANDGAPVTADLFPGRHLAGLAACALLMAAAFALFYTAISFHQVSRSALFVNLNPFHVALIAHFALGERLNRWQVAGMVLAFCGVTFVEYRTLRHGLGSPLATGDLLILASGILWASQAVLKKRLTRSVAIETITVWEVLPMGLILIAAGSLTEGWSFVRWNAHAVGSLLYLTLLGTSVAFLGFNWVLGQADASQVAPFSFFIPVTAYALGILVLAEPFQPVLAVALATVVIGLYAVTAAGRNGNRGAGRNGNPGARQGSTAGQV